MILFLHEWWLLRRVGVGMRERRELLSALVEAGQRAGEVDLLAEVGGYTLAKRSVPKDLATLFDELMTPYSRPVHGVAYGRRRYRKPVILAAALHQAGISAAAYRTGLAGGCRTMKDFASLPRPSS